MTTALSFSGDEESLRLSAWMTRSARRRASGVDILHGASTRRGWRAAVKEVHLARKRARAFADLRWTQCSISMRGVSPRSERQWRRGRRCGLRRGAKPASRARRRHVGRVGTDRFQMLAVQYTWSVSKSHS